MPNVAIDDLLEWLVLMESDKLLQVTAIGVKRMSRITSVALQVRQPQNDAFRQQWFGGLGHLL
jgi:hypothetical protein